MHCYKRGGKGAPRSHFGVPPLSSAAAHSTAQADQPTIGACSALDRRGSQGAHRRMPGEPMAPIGGPLMPGAPPGGAPPGGMPPIGGFWPCACWGLYPMRCKNSVYVLCKPMVLSSISDAKNRASKGSPHRMIFSCMKGTVLSDRTCARMWAILLDSGSPRVPMTCSPWAGSSCSKDGTPKSAPRTPVSTARPIHMRIRSPSSRRYMPSWVIDSLVRFSMSGSATRPCSSGMPHESGALCSAIILG
mmetsp:Transcript_103224/g.262090  ORF Transcript_103224/g.262090 Transcript_103224/m.262090 type:complete len:246 (-) Transcript_103224:1620-2357(-)